MLGGEKLWLKGRKARLARHADKNHANAAKSLKIICFEALFCFLLF